MLWNRIRDHALDRLPAIVDFTLFTTFITTATAILLGLTWLYINYRPALFVVALVLIWIASGFAGRRTPVPLALGSDKPAQAATRSIPIVFMVGLIRWNMVWSRALHGPAEI